MRFSFDLRELGGASTLTLLSPKAISLFQRARVICGSTIVDDVDYVGRVVTMLDRLKPANRAQNEMIMNGGGVNTSLQSASGTLKPITASGARTFVCDLSFLGLFNQHKWIPCGLMGSLVIELELNSDVAYATIGSTDWCIENPVIFANDKILDSALQSKYVEHVMSGKNLPIVTSCLANTLHIVPSATFTVALARGFSRLNAIILTLHNANDAGTKQINDFHHPAGGAAPIGFTADSVKLQVQIGAKKMPEYEISSVAEFYYRLQEVVGVLTGESAMNIDSRQYHSTAFIAGINMEKLSGSGADYSGINSKEQLLTASWKGCGAASQCYITLVYQSIINVKSGGVELLD